MAAILSRGRCDIFGEYVCESNVSYPRDETHYVIMWLPKILSLVEPRETANVLSL